MDRIRLIASDMDATLLDQNGQLPPDFERTVKALAEKGIRFAAASGRPLYTLEEMFSALRREMILIGDNGGAIRWNGEDLYTSEMPPDGWRRLAKKTRAAGDVAVLCGLKSAYVERQYQQYDRVMKQFYTRVEYVDDLTAVTAPADKFTIYLPRDNAQEAYDSLYGPECGAEFSVAVAGKNWVDIMNTGVHKGAALEILGKKLCISPDEMMTFGDTYNDAEMLELARYGFLMENGSLPLRQRVNFLAPPHWDHGVMQILHKLLDQNGAVCPEDFCPAH